MAGANENREMDLNLFMIEGYSKDFIYTKSFTGLLFESESMSYLRKQVRHSIK
jgi:hypothetical protein